MTQEIYILIENKTKTFQHYNHETKKKRAHFLHDSENLRLHVAHFHQNAPQYSNS